MFPVPLFSCVDVSDRGWAFVFMPCVFGWGRLCMFLGSDEFRAAFFTTSSLFCGLTRFASHPFFLLSSVTFFQENIAFVIRVDRFFCLGLRVGENEMRERDNRKCVASARRTLNRLNIRSDCVMLFKNKACGFFETRA